MMAVKRTLLLILGLVGSLAAVTALYVSAVGTLMVYNTPQLPTASLPQKFATAEISLPTVLSDTTLLLQNLYAYDGPFLENGSDAEVVNVAALQVCNIGDRELLKVHITLIMDTESYVFCGEHIPPGIPVVLLETDGKAFQKDGIIYCAGWQETKTQEPLEGIAVADRAMGTLVVTNLTNRTFYNVRVHYKSWLSPPDVYVGGITYEVQIPVLRPGQTEYLYPFHYATGFSKVVCVTADG